MKMLRKSTLTKITLAYIIKIMKKKKTNRKYSIFIGVHKGIVYKAYF